MSCLDQFVNSKKLSELYEVERVVIAVKNHKTFRIEVRRNCKQPERELPYDVLTYVEETLEGLLPEKPSSLPSTKFWKRIDIHEVDRHDADSALKQALLDLENF